MISIPEFGIGAQVHVRDADSGEPAPWRDEPSGVIVRAGGSALSGVWGRAGGARNWVVAFDAPATTTNGDGPFESAQVQEKFLELAPPVGD